MKHVCLSGIMRVESVVARSARYEGERLVPQESSIPHRPVGKMNLLHLMRGILKKRFHSHLVVGADHSEDQILDFTIGAEAPADLDIAWGDVGRHLNDIPVA